jgi:tungstate transport system permease protein
MEFLFQMVAQGFDRIVDGDAQVLGALGRTLLLAIVSTCLAVLAGLPLGVLLADPRTRARRVGLTIANAGLGLPPVVLGVWLALALLPGSILGGLAWPNTLQAVVLAQTLLAFPIVVALTAAALARVPPGLTDQARAYGASRIQVALLGMREARVGITAMVITALGSAVAEVGAVVIVGGNDRGQTDTLASAVLLDIGAGDPARATAHALVLLAVVLVLATALTVVQRHDRRGKTGGYGPAR